MPRYISEDECQEKCDVQKVKLNKGYFELEEKYDALRRERDSRRDRGEGTRSYQQTTPMNIQIPEREMEPVKKPEGRFYPVAEEGKTPTTEQVAHQQYYDYQQRLERERLRAIRQDSRFSIVLPESLKSLQSQGL